jgi:uncharacterized protein (TIGR01370 family)
MRLPFLLRSSLSRKIRYGLGLLAGLVASLCFGGASANTMAAPRSIAFYYGKAPILKQLAQFEFAVVEPGHGFVPVHTSHKTRWIAYVSVGEVNSSRDYYSAIPKSWIIGHNAEWSSDIIDQTAPGWPEFFVEHVIAPLWRQGYSGFFLDTLDSYQLVVKDAAQRQQNQEGLVAVIRAIHKRFPRAALILNRGFELLPEVHNDVYAVAFESLFKGWSESRGEYIDVSDTDREWLLAQASTVKQQYGLPVIAIDYCLPTNLQCSRDTVRRIRALGLVPYVGDGRLQTVNLASRH